MLLQRVSWGADAMSPARRWRSPQGAARRCWPGRPGQIAPGFRADLAIWDPSGIERRESGDPAAILLAGPNRVRDLIVEGNAVVQTGG